MSFLTPQNQANPFMSKAPMPRPPTPGFFSRLKSGLGSGLNNIWNNPNTGLGRALNPASKDYVGNKPGMSGNPYSTKPMPWMDSYKSNSNPPMTPTATPAKPTSGQMAASTSVPRNGVITPPQNNAGSYRGTPINPGDQASIQDQMRNIDSQNNQNNTTPTPSSTPNSTSPTNPSYWYDNFGQNSNQNSNQTNSNVEGMIASGDIGGILGSGLDPQARYNALQRAYQKVSALGSNPAYEEALSNVNKTGQALAQAQGAKKGTEADLNAKAEAAPVVGDFLNKNLNFADMMADTKISNIAGLNTAANSSLQTQLGQLQAARQARVAGADAALGAAAPSLTSPGMVPFFPLGGGEGNMTGFGGGAGGGVNNFVNSLADQVRNNQMTRQEAESRLGFAGAAGLNALNQALGGSFDTAANTSLTNTRGSFAGEYIQGQSQLRSADAIKNRIISTFANNPLLNRTALSPLTRAKEFWAGQTSDPNQQQLSQQVAAYISALGLTPDYVSNIAAQRGGTLAQLLQNLYNLRRDFVESKNPNNFGGNFGGGGGSNNDPLGIF